MQSRPLSNIISLSARVVAMFYRQNKDLNRFLRSNGSISRKTYFRILALATIDALFTLPIGVVNIVLTVTSLLYQGELPVYPGWAEVHSQWEPQAISYAYIKSRGTAQLAADYFSIWSSPVLAFIVFGLFGLTTEAQASYWRVIHYVIGWFGWKPAVQARDTERVLDTMEFGDPVREVAPDAETGYV